MLFKLCLCLLVKYVCVMIFPRGKNMQQEICYMEYNVKELQNRNGYYNENNNNDNNRNNYNDDDDMTTTMRMMINIMMMRMITIKQ